MFAGSSTCFKFSTLRPSAGRFLNSFLSSLVANWTMIFGGLVVSRLFLVLFMARKHLSMSVGWSSMPRWNAMLCTMFCVCSFGE